MKTVYTPSLINSLAVSSEKFIRDCDEKYRAGVTECANRIFADPDKKIIMLAGPSSSGKTTTAKILSEIIAELGGTAYTVSLDDFYRQGDDKDYPLNEKGEPDYECVEALDISLIKKCIKELIDDNESLLPTFDFTTGHRSDNAKKIALDDNDIIIIEGLHALNPVITEGIDGKNLFKIFVSVGTRIYDESGNVLLSRAEIRFVRRAVRDYYTRAMEIERTFAIWQSVKSGERKFLYPYEQYADFEIDSFHPCEMCILRDAALELLSDGDFGEFSVSANEYISKLNRFRSVDPSMLSEDSLLNEFLPFNK